MHFAKPILIAVLGIAFSAYGFDCSPMLTPDQAMECCDSMNCSHGVLGQDCCQTAPSTHAPFVQPVSAHGVSVAPLMFVALPASIELNSVDPAHGLAATRYHDPPPLFGRTAPLQLRI